MRSPSDSATDEPIRRELEHLDGTPPPTDPADEPIRNDAERFDHSPLTPHHIHSPPTTTTHHPDEPIRNDAERFPIAPAGNYLRPAPEIGDIHLPGAEPDVPDGVLPYADLLCTRQQSAIKLLLGGERPGAVAEKLGIGRTTLWRWRKYDWQFRRALAAARQAVFGEAVERLRCLVPEAVDVLHARMKEGSDLAADRLLRLARVDRYEPETEDYPERDHTPWHE